MSLETLMPHKQTVQVGDSNINISNDNQHSLDNKRLVSPYNYKTHTQSLITRQTANTAKPN